MYKTNDQLKFKGQKITIGINNVMIFHYFDGNIELWKDEEGYSIGIANIKDGEETRYKRYMLGEEPKKWADRAHKAIEIYNSLFNKIEFKNYI